MDLGQKHPEKCPGWFLDAGFQFPISNFQIENWQLAMAQVSSFRLQATGCLVEMMPEWWLRRLVAVGVVPKTSGNLRRRGRRRHLKELFSTKESQALGFRFPPSQLLSAKFRLTCGGIGVGWAEQFNGQRGYEFSTSGRQTEPSFPPHIIKN
jgi:hypothetical protein